MKIGRSFIALLCAGVALEASGLAFAVLGLNTLAGCYWAFWPGGWHPAARCMEPIPVAGFHLFLPAALLGLVVLATAGAAAAYACRLVRGVRALRARLGARVDPSPDVLAAARTAGLGDVELREDALAYAGCMGLWHPVVIASSGLVELLSFEELVAVLAHEQRHRRRHAPLRQLVARTTARSLFFIPLLVELLDRHLVDEEILADEDACRVAGRQALVSALAKLAGVDPEPLVPAIGGTAALAQRLDSLEGRARRMHLSRSHVLLSVGSLVSLVLLVVWMPLASPL